MESEKLPDPADRAKLLTAVGDKDSPHQLAYQIYLDRCKHSGKFPFTCVNRPAACFRIRQLYEHNRGLSDAQEAIGRVSVDIAKGHVSHLFSVHN